MYTFKKTKDPDNEYDCNVVTIECDSNERQELINTFIEFLAGCGFSVKDLKDEWYN
jgi:glycine cleavage system regulatory protein